jgi:hypothetical protein
MANNVGTVVTNIETQASNGFEWIHVLIPGWKARGIPLKDAWANGMNDANAVVGSTGYNAFVWTAESGLTWLRGNSHARFTSATDINNKGVIVGGSNGPCVWVNRILIPLGDTGTNLPQSYAYEINDHGVITGNDGDAHAYTGWIWDGDYEVLGIGTSIGDINNAGEHLVRLDSARGVRSLDGHFVQLHSPDPNLTFAGLADINDQGWVVGGISNAWYSNETRAYIWIKAGELYEAFDLNLLLEPGSSGWHLDGATNIAASGEIYGIGKYLGIKSVFKLTPI